MRYELISPLCELSEIEQILVNRGINFQDIDHYLNTTEEDNLNPSMIDRIHQGAEILAKHIHANDKVFLQVDSDCDGYTSSAVLLNYLHYLFPYFVENNIVYRFHEGKQHGLILDTIPDDVKLVLAPDSSSNDYSVHEELSKRGIDVIVIDHHEAEEISKYACIINNQLCDYPTKSLSGVGMVYKFCQYLDSIMGTSYADTQLDLVALGETADMMDLRDFETRHLITKGLAKISNPFIDYMVDKNSFSLKGELTPIGVAFYIAPYVNAITRSGTQAEKDILFKSMLEYKAFNLIKSTKRGCKGQLEPIVEQSIRNCVNVKNRQAKSRDNGLIVIEEIIKENNLLDNQILMVCIPSEKQVEKTLTGLIANQLVSKYQKPTLILNEAEDNTWQGSARGYETFDFRKFCLNSNMVMYAEGHSGAFGFGIKDEYVKAFIEYANTELSEFNFEPYYKVDFIYSSSNFNKNSILNIAKYRSLWGEKMDEPYIAITDIKVSKENTVLLSPDKKPTIKIILPNGVELLKFKASKEEYNNLVNNNFAASVLTIVGRCDINTWGGNITPQVLIEDYEVEESIQYYF